MATKKVIPIKTERTDICKNCRFCHFLKSGDFQCRKSPPILSEDGDGLCWSFPQVLADTWCGEFKPALNS